MLRRTELRQYGAIPPSVARDEEENDFESAAARRARHRRFVQSRKRRQERKSRGLTERGDDDKDKPSDGEDTPGDETPSSDDETSTIKPPPPPTQSSSIAVSSTSAIASTTTSLIAVTTTTTPPPPPPAKATLTSLATSTLSTSSSLSLSTPVRSSSSSISSSIIASAIPELQSQTSTVSTTSTTSQPFMTYTTSQPTSTSTDSGQTSNKGVTQDSKSSGVGTALIVIGVLIAVIAIALVTWGCMKRSSLRERLNRRRGIENIQNEKWPTQRTRNNRPSPSDTESRIWAAASTVGGTETEASFPAYVPPGQVYMGPGLVDANRDMGNGLKTYLEQTVPVRPPEPVMQKQDRRSESGSRWPSVRDSVVTTTTLASIPRFRDIRSWARDQRRRGRSEEVPPTPYRRLD